MKTSRRRFISMLVAGSAISSQYQTNAYAAQVTSWHKNLAQQAKALYKGIPLRVLIPHGSGANIKAATDEFNRLSGVPCIIEEVKPDDMNLEVILRVTPGNNIVDVVLPATFGLIDLVHANAVISLDSYAQKYQPPGFYDDHLYRSGDYIHNGLYGYQTDGDAYLLFYNKQMMEDPAEQVAYKALTGKTLAPASSWEDLDSMMAFFHRPEQNQYGGSLFRNAAYLVWEWWARFHAKGNLPFTTDMQANINNTAGVEALEELILATDSLTPGARTNGLFENWIEYSKGNVFCNIGWGGTQKFLMEEQTMRDNVIHGALPGPVVDGENTTVGYFNWGWSYAVSSLSTQPELAYLLALFCTSPVVSTLAIRETGGFFDPFREHHYQDEDIQRAYGSSFLNAHRQSLTNVIPDLYLSAQSNYVDVLRQHILATVNGELSAAQSLDKCAQKWMHITRRHGKQAQAKQWQELLATYPASFSGLADGS